MKIKLIAVVCLVWGIHTDLSAQVTIGSHQEPQKASLLELREVTDNSDYSNANKGLLLPRVTLSDTEELYPMFSTGTPNNAEYLANKDDFKKNHIGLLVYNVNTSVDFTPGFYYWDGEKWERIETNI